MSPIPSVATAFALSPAAPSVALDPDSTGQHASVMSQHLFGTGGLLFAVVAFVSVASYFYRGRGTANSCQTGSTCQWPETSFTSVDPLPLLGVLQQCVFVFRVWISALRTQILSSAAHLQPLDSSLKNSAVLLFLPNEGDPWRYLANSRCPRTVLRRGWTGWGMRTGFACDTSSALEWYGLFMYAVSVVRLSFYSSCCIQNPEKIYLIYKTP